MCEHDLVSKQPGSHAYRRASVERLDTLNILNRAFDVPAPNKVLCGDITYIYVPAGSRQCKRWPAVSGDQSLATTPRSIRSLRLEAHEQVGAFDSGFNSMWTV